MGQVITLALLSEKEAAAYICVSLSTMRRWRRTHSGPAFFRHGGVLRYRREALDDFVCHNTSGTE
jgi:Helix-turn-helix domain